MSHLRKRSTFAAGVATLVLLALPSLAGANPGSGPELVQRSGRLVVVHADRADGSATRQWTLVRGAAHVPVRAPADVWVAPGTPVRLEGTMQDGTLVLAHSDDLLEVSHGAAGGRVRGQSLAALRELAPELPTLDEALEQVRSGETVGVQVDLKGSGFEERVAATIRRHGLVDRSVVSTFHVPSLLRLARYEPAIPRGLTYPVDRRGLSQRRLLFPVAVGVAAALRRALPRRIAGLLARARASAAMLHYSVVSPAAVDRAHAHGAAVFAWTVDDEPLLERMLAAGVDAVITNDPRIFGSGD